MKQCTWWNSKDSLTTRAKSFTIHFCKYQAMNVKTMRLNVQALTNESDPFGCDLQRTPPCEKKSPED